MSYKFYMDDLYLLATSEPASDSLTPMQATISPAIVGARNSFFSSSVPNL